MLHLSKEILDLYLGPKPQHFFPDYYLALIYKIEHEEKMQIRLWFDEQEEEKEVYTYCMSVGGERIDRAMIALPEPSMAGYVESQSVLIVNCLLLGHELGHLALGHYRRDIPDAGSGVWTWGETGAENQAATAFSVLVALNAGLHVASYGFLQENLAKTLKEEHLHPIVAEYLEALQRIPTLRFAVESHSLSSADLASIAFHTSRLASLLTLIEHVRLSVADGPNEMSERAISMLRQSAKGRSTNVMDIATIHLSSPGPIALGPKKGFEFLKKALPYVREKLKKLPFADLYLEKTELELGEDIRERQARKTVPQALLDETARAKAEADLEEEQLRKQEARARSKRALLEEMESRWHLAQLARELDVASLPPSSQEDAQKCLPRIRESAREIDKRDVRPTE